MSITVLPTPDAVAETVAVRLLDQLEERQRAGQSPIQLGLTGGTIAGKVYHRLSTLAADREIDWSGVHLWWGDERFVNADSDDRNDRQAQAGLGPIWEQAQRHQMPAAPGDLDEAAASYADELADVTLDICLLGMGPDGHVASLFPDHRAQHEPGRVIAVRNSPKPPPERISLTLEVINASSEVWFVLSGADKAPAAARAMNDDQQLPAGRARGQRSTWWVLDDAAASQLG